MSCCCFLGAFSGFFFPPSRPDILMKLEVKEQIGHETRPALEKNYTLLLFSFLVSPCT